MLTKVTQKTQIDKNEVKSIQVMLEPKIQIIRRTQKGKLRPYILVSRYLTFHSRFRFR